MKRLLLFSILSIFCFTISAQTKTWVGPAGGDFNVAANWDPAGVPGTNNDVVIPTGRSLIIAGATIKSFDLQGNAMMDINYHLSTTSASTISADAVVTWNEGFIYGSGTITNHGVINLEGVGDLLLQNSMILNNDGVINVNLTATFRIGYGSPTLNNLPTGVMNLNSDGGIAGGSGAGTIVNTGLIKRKQGTGVFEIGIPLQNNDGTLSVESGTLKLAYANTVLSDGTYNVTANGILEWADNLTCLGTLTGQLDGPINWTGILHVASGTEATFDFNGPAGVNWFTGYLRDNGTLTNRGILNLEGASERSMSDQIILNNEGVINVNCTAAFRLGYGSPTLNNLPSGVINLNSDSSILGGSGQGTIVNTGLIKRKQGTGIFSIGIPLQNNDGTISVESGTLKLVDDLIVLTDGIYNVTVAGILEWADNLTCLGTLTGQLDGPINWTGILHVASGTEATFDFDGSAGVNWYTGYLRDNGTLTNAGILNLEGVSDRSMADQIILNNEGTINVNCTATFRLGYGSPTLNNLSSGIINLNSDGGIAGGSGAGTIVNTGIIKKETSSGNFKIGIPVNNLVSGKIIAENGLLNFTGSFEGNGTITGNGSIQLTNTTTFEGTVAPGGSPGILTYNGNYQSSSNTILVPEINGPIAETGYDVFDIQGNAAMDGNIVVALSYTANLNDEFVIVTSPNITSCNLPATVTAHYDNHDYTFDVVCNPNDVTLKVTDIVLGTEENNLSNLSMYPNPTNGNFIVDLGREYSDVTVQITNMLGQIISSEIYSSAKIISQEINASAGTYFVKVSTAKEGSNTLRIIKQ